MTDAYYDDDNFTDEFSTDQDITLGVWSTLLRFALRYPVDLVFLGLSAVVVGIAEISFPLVTRAVIDDAAALGLELDLSGYAFLYAGLCIALGVSVGGFLWFGGKLRSHMSHDIRAAGFENLQRLSFAYYDQRPVGWLMARMTSDCERLSNIMAWGILDLFWSFTIMLGIAGAMLIMEPLLGCIILISLPALAWVSRYFQARILKSAREVRQTNSRITGAYNENIMGVLTSKVFVKEADNLNKFGQLMLQLFVEIGMTRHHSRTHGIGRTIFCRSFSIYFSNFGMIGQAQIVIDTPSDDLFPHKVHAVADGSFQFWKNKIAFGVFSPFSNWPLIFVKSIK